MHFDSPVSPHTNGDILVRVVTSLCPSLKVAQFFQTREYMPCIHKLITGILSSTGD